jgi:hypothetical protein
MPGSFAECPAVGTSFTNRHKFGKPMSISQSAQTTGDEIETSHRTPHLQESFIPTHHLTCNSSVLCPYNGAQIKYIFQVVYMLKHVAINVKRSLYPVATPKHHCKQARQSNMAYNGCHIFHARQLPVMIEHLTLTAPFHQSIPIY